MLLQENNMREEALLRELGFESLDNVAKKTTISKATKDAVARKQAAITQLASEESVSTT